jgi:hypothetical protein
VEGRLVALSARVLVDLFVIGAVSLVAADDVVVALFVSMVMVAPSSSVVGMVRLD